MTLHMIGTMVSESHPETRHVLIAVQKVERVRIMALSLAKTISPAPDMKVVELAALLHDVSGGREYSVP